MSRHASKASTLNHLAEQPVFARCTRKELEAVSRLGTTINVARIDDFKYEKLRLGQLSSASWSAYAVDAINGAY